MHPNFVFGIRTHLEIKIRLCFEPDSISEHSNCYSLFFLVLGQNSKHFQKTGK